MQVLGGYYYIPVSNLQQTGDWYKEHLGFSIVKEDPTYLELRTESGVRILLLPNEDQLTSHMKFPNGPQAAYGFTVSDIDALYQQFVDRGIQVGKLFNYAGKSFSFHDPDGNVIELWSDHPIS